MKSRTQAHWLRSAGWLGILALAALGAGCLHLEPTLTLAPDGTGTLRLLYAMKEPMLGQVQSFHRLAEQLQQAEPGGGTNAPVRELQIPCVYDETVIRQQLKPYEARGIKIKALRCDTRQGWRHVDLVLQFDTLEHVMALPCFADCAVALKRVNGDDYRLTIQAPDLSGDQPLPDLAEPKTSKTLGAILAGFSLAVRIRTPQEIVSTNANRNDGREAAWVFDFDKDPKALAELNKAVLQVVFQGTGLYLKEFDRPAAP